MTGRKKFIGGAIQPSEVVSRVRMTKTKPRPTWREAAEQLAAAISRERLHPAVLAWAEKSPVRAAWSVAFSGGADSLALLLLLWAHWPERRPRLQACHFNHRLRGRESQADAVFCRRVCAALGVKFISDSWRTGRTDASEAEARGARHTFLSRHSRALWLGHQQDDIAETMLMRLARGSGAGGLAAPRPVQAMPAGRVHLRPLLALKKSEIVAALKRCGVSWREDSSNQGENFFRNRVRRRVLPAWVKASQRDALGGAARSRELLEEDEAAFDAWLAELEISEKGGALKLDVLALKPRALVRRALHRWLLAQTRAGELSRQGFDALLDAVERGKPTRQSLGSAGFAVIRVGRLSFVFHGKRRSKFQRPAN
jgi:tRNA(Ile)-lysidine synthase